MCVDHLSYLLSSVDWSSCDEDETADEEGEKAQK